MDVFSALAQPTRREIVELLAKNGQMKATAIYQEFTSTPQAISQHLKVLLQAKLVTVEERAQMRLYQINMETVQELEAWVQELHALWDTRFDQLDQLLNDETSFQTKREERS